MPKPTAVRELPLPRLRPTTYTSTDAAVQTPASRFRSIPFSLVISPLQQRPRPIPREQQKTAARPRTAPSSAAARTAARRSALTENGAYTAGLVGGPSLVRGSSPGSSGSTGRELRRRGLRALGDEHAASKTSTCASSTNQASKSAAVMTMPDSPEHEHGPVEPRAAPPWWPEEREPS